MGFILTLVLDNTCVIYKFNCSHLLSKGWGGWIPNEDGCGGDYHFNSKHICLNLAGEKFDGWVESHGERIAIMAKASKRAAGRLLDGQEHNEMPEKQ